MLSFARHFAHLAWLATALVLVMLLSACAGPSIATPPAGTQAPDVTATVAAPTAALGFTTGAACESGTLSVKDLTEIQSRWIDGIKGTGDQALQWQDDAYLVELAVSCELFEPGFRWQTTYFSKTAQSFYRADTTEVIPANALPDTVIALPKSDIDFKRLLTVLTSDQKLDLQPEYVITALDVRVNTETRPLGPKDVPYGVPIYHVTVQTPGQTLELYVDITTGTIYQYSS